MLVGFGVLRLRGVDQTKQLMHLKDLGSFADQLFERRYGVRIAPRFISLSARSEEPILLASRAAAGRSRLCAGGCSLRTRTTGQNQRQQQTAQYAESSLSHVKPMLAP